MKIAMILSDYSTNRLKYISAGGILSELLERNADCELFIVMKKSVKKRAFFNQHKKNLQRKILTMLARFDELSFSRFAEEKTVTPEKVLTSFSKYIGQDRVNRYCDTISKYIEDYPHKILTTIDLNSQNFLQQMNALKPDIGIARGGGIFKKKFIDTFVLGILNLHGSGPLPYYRGLGSLEFALIDDKNIYMNVHYIDSGIDTGQILSQKQLILNGKETLSDIYAKIYAEGINVIVDTIESVLDSRTLNIYQKLSEGRQHFLPHPFFENIALAHLNNKMN